MRRLYDLWERYVPGTPALFMEVPKKKDPLSVDFFATELRRLSERIQDRFGPSMKTDVQALRDAIKACNGIRKKMNELFSWMGKQGRQGRGKEIFALCHERPDLSDEALLGAAEPILAETGGVAGEGNGRGVILSGSHFRVPDLIYWVEESGGRIAGLDTCITARHVHGLVDEGAQDPYRALAERYV